MDAAITEWTSKRTKQEVTRVIAGAGVPCGAVMTTLELLHDPDLHARGMMQKIAAAGDGSAPRSRDSRLGRCCAGSALTAAAALLRGGWAAVLQELPAPQRLIGLADDLGGGARAQRAPEGTRGSARAPRAPGRGPSSRCVAARRVPGDSRCGHRHTPSRAGRGQRSFGQHRPGQARGRMRRGHRGSDRRRQPTRHCPAPPAAASVGSPIRFWCVLIPRSCHPPDPPEMITVP